MRIHGWARRRVAVVLALALAIAVPVAGCNQGKDGSLARVKKAKQIVVATDNTYPPMEYDENGKLVGFDVDLMDAIAKKIGVKVKWQPTGWDGIFSGLTGKQYDTIASSVSITDERKKSMAFSVPYLVAGQVIVVKKGTTGITKLDDLKGKRIAVQIGTIQADAADALAAQDKKTQVFRYDTFPAALDELKVGRADAVLLDEPVGRYYLATKGQDFEVAGPSFDSGPFGIALRQADNDLREAINKALADLEKDGTYKQLTKKWFGKEMSLPKSGG